MRRVSSISTIVFGDSVALGLAQAAGLPCDAVVGRGPEAVLYAVESTPSFLVGGRLVVLSSGLSNNPDGRSYVLEQLRRLEDHSAEVVVLLGVGSGVRVGTNEWLEDQVKSFPRTLFAGPLQNTRPDGVHPWSYEQLVEQVNAVLQV